MANYYETEEVSVFPSALRISNLGGKYTTEENFTTIIKSICDKDSFVIAHKNSRLEVVIDGYYFNIYLPTKPQNLTLYINVPTNTRLLSSVGMSPSTTALDTTTSGVSYFRGLYYSIDNPAKPPTNYITGSLLVYKDGILQNTCWLTPFSDGNGNWINIKNFFITEGDNITIDPYKLNIAKLRELLKNPSYDFIVSGARYLTDGTNKLNVGGYKKDSSKKGTNSIIKIKDGVPVVSTNIIFSDAAPTTADGLNPGDIWFVYK